MSAAAHIFMFLWIITLWINLCWFSSLLSHIGSNNSLNHVKFHLKDCATCLIGDRSHGTEVLLRKSRWKNLDNFNIISLIHHKKKRNKIYLLNSSGKRVNFIYFHLRCLENCWVLPVLNHVIWHHAFKYP